MDIYYWEKYLSPQNIKYLYQNNKTISSIIKYINNPSNKLLVLVGNCGSGKSYLIKVIINDIGFSFVNIFLSQEECLKKTVVNLKKINNSSVIDFYLNKKKISNNNIIVLDELECCNIYDKKYILEIVHYFTKNNIPIILICNEKYNKIVESLNNISINITINSPSNEKIKNISKELSCLLNLNFSDKIYNIISRKSQNDYRKLQDIMLNLYNLISHNNINNEKYIIKYLNYIYDKEIEQCLVDITYNFFNNNVNSIDNSEKLFQMEKILLPRIINENILKIIYENKKEGIDIYNSILNIYNIYELYSIYDYLDTSMFKCDIFTSFYSIICCYYPCIISRNLTKKRNIKKNFSFPQLMIKRSQIKNCINLYNNFNKKFYLDYKSNFYLVNLIHSYKKINHREEIYNNYNITKYFDKINKIF